jgi:hypothetical protein
MMGGGGAGVESEMADKVPFYKNNLGCFALPLLKTKQSNGHIILLDT